MAEHAPQIGLRTISLGTGLTLYKRRLMNASISVAEGSVERPSWLSFFRGARRRAKRFVLAPAASIGKTSAPYSV
jgi:hypothetical protein